MAFRTVTAAAIASWEAEAGPTPIHGMGLDLTQGGQVEWHRHHRGQVMVAEAGVLTVSTPQTSYVVAGTRGAWVPAGVPHAISTSSEVKLRNLQIDRRLAPSLPGGPCLISVSPLFKALIGTAIAGENSFRKGSRQAKVVDLLVMEFRATCDIAFNFPEPKDRRLKRICAALRDNPGDTRPLSTWAETAGGCVRTLGRLFQKETGLTFAQWRRQVRLHDAVIRLHRGEPVTSVAFDTGYENPSAFIEMFRRVTGRTPGQFLDG